MHSQFVPNFWRADTDNDSRGWKTRERFGFWTDLESKWIETRCDVKSGIVSVVKRAENCVVLSLKYSMSPVGRLYVDFDLLIGELCPEPLRVGLSGLWSNPENEMSFFGRGPVENYSDRCEGAFVGYYSGKVDDFSCDYVMPQENGNHTEVYYCKIGGRPNVGFYKTIR